MKILFVHQNMPGQFKHLAPACARAGHEVVFLTKRGGVELRGVRSRIYKPRRTAADTTHNYIRLFENSVLHGQEVLRSCQALLEEGFRPDLVVAHPGWGEALFLKDVLPRVPLVNYCEFFYSARGADVGFDPSEPPTMDTVCRVRARNAHLLLSLEACDAGLAPTEWQKSRHPAPFLGKITTIFDGVDTNVVRANPQASFQLPGGRVLTAADEVVTFVARNLEPYRGFPSFMRALPTLLARRPQASVVIVGGDEVSYGSSAPGGKTWRETLLDEVELPPGRVHFLGRLAYARYLSLLQVSSVHVYLTVPFVLSWSFLEAMAAQCVLVASKTAPVEELLVDGENGFFTDFFAADRLAADIEMALLHPDRERIRGAARGTILGRYDLASCLPRQFAFLSQVAGRPLAATPVVRRGGGTAGRAPDLARASSGGGAGRAPVES